MPLESKHKPGDRIGLLTLISRVGTNKDGRPLFRFKCDCGGEKITIWKKTRSCGCLQMNVRMSNGRARRLDFGVAAFNNLYAAYRYGAVKRGLSFVISRVEFYKLTQKNCVYCGKPPSQVRKKMGGCNGDFVYNGIDRIDNARGYEVDNVASCCKMCQNAKRDYSVLEFLEWVKRISDFQCSIKNSV